jgi:hypothetical protein
MSTVEAESGVVRRPSSRVILVLAVGVASSGALLLTLQSRLTFFADEWRFLLDRRGSSVGVFLDPHNDHIALAPVSIYKALLATFGMSSAAPFQIVSTALFLLSAILLFAYLDSRVGDRAALLGTILVLFLGAAWIDLLWPFQIGFFGSMAAGLGALLALDRDDAAGDRAACLLLVLSTAFLELGIPFAVAALVSVALGRRPRGGRLYVGLVPIVLYAVWYAGWGHQATHKLTVHNLVSSPKYVFDAASQAIASLLGLATPLTGDGHNLVGLPWGRALLVAGIVLSIWRVRRVGGPSRGLWTALTLGLGFWFLASLNAGSFLREPSDGRYQYPGAIFVLLIAAELLSGIRLGKPALAVATIVTAAAAVSGIFFLHDGYRLQRSASELTRARLAALEIERQNVQPGFAVYLDLVTSFDAGAYFSAVDAFGSPAWSESELASSGEVERQAADQLLASASRIRLRPATTSDQGHATCLRVPESPTGSRSQPLPPGTYTLMSPMETGVHLVRFADRPAVDLGPLPAGQLVTLEILPDRSPRRWRLALVGSRTASLCSGGPVRS